MKTNMKLIDAKRQRVENKTHNIQVQAYSKTLLRLCIPGSIVDNPWLIHIPMYALHALPMCQFIHIPPIHLLAF